MQRLGEGRGGLPEDPSKPLNGETIWTDLRFFTSTQNQPSSPPVDTTKPTDSATDPLVEASGWAMNSKGEVILTAAAPSAAVQIPWLNSSSCNA